MSLEMLLWDKNVWGILVLIVLFIFGILSIVFVYHWKRYGDDLPIIKVGSFIYFIGSVALITLIVLTYQTLP